MKTFIVLALLVTGATSFATNSQTAICTFVRFVKKAGVAAFLKDCTGPVGDKVAIFGDSDFPSDTQGLTNLFSSESPGEKVSLSINSIGGEYGGIGHFADRVTTANGSFTPHQAYILSWADALTELGN